MAGSRRLSARSRQRSPDARNRACPIRTAPLGARRCCRFDHCRRHHRGCTCRQRLENDWVLSAELIDIIDVDSLERALEIAARVPFARIGQVEVRPLMHEAPDNA